MKHHLDEIEIKAFRQLKDLKLEDLGRVNVFVGENNSGKTSVLEAISLFCRPLDPFAWIATGRRREKKSSRESVLDAVRWLFPQTDAQINDPLFKGEIRIDGEGKFSCRELHAHYEGLQVDDESSDSEDEYESSEDEDSDDGFEEYSDGTSNWGNSLEEASRAAEVKLQVKVDRNEWLLFEADPNTFFVEYTFELFADKRFTKREKTAGPLLDTTTLSPYSHRVERIQTKRLSDATLRNTKFNVLKCVKQIDPEIEDIVILSPTGIGSSIYFKRIGTGFTPLSSMGDGVRRIFSIAVSLASVEHGAIFIDEIEAAVHKDAFLKVFQWLVGAAKYFDVQVFASTHSLEAIDAILSSSDDDLNELVVYQLPDRGNEELKRFSGDLLHRLRFERGLDLR